MKSEYSLISYTKINSKWIKDLNIRQDTIKLSEENAGQTSSDIKGIHIFSDLPPRVMKIKTKIKKRDLLKLKSFWSSHYGIAKTNLTRNHEIVGSIPDLAEWVEDLELP